MIIFSETSPTEVTIQYQFPINFYSMLLTLYTIQPKLSELEEKNLNFKSFPFMFYYDLRKNNNVCFP